MAPHPLSEALAGVDTSGNDRPIDTHLQFSSRFLLVIDTEALPVRCKLILGFRAVYRA